MNQQTPIAALNTLYRQHMATEDALETAEVRIPVIDAMKRKWSCLIKRREVLQDAILMTRAVTPQDALCQMAQISIEMDWLTGCHHTAEHMSDRIEVLHAALASAVLALAGSKAVDIDALGNDYFPVRMEFLAPPPMAETVPGQAV
jgi:hypothetical protein